MATLRGWFNNLTKDIPKEFLASTVAGTSMTIPGQGSDLALIIQSIVKLPPLDGRTFDDPTGEADPETLRLRKEVEGLYPATGVNLAEDIEARRKVMKSDKEKEKATETTKESTTTTTDSE